MLYHADSQPKIMILQGEDVALCAELAVRPLSSSLLSPISSILDLLYLPRLAMRAAMLVAAWSRCDCLDLLGRASLGRLWVYVYPCSLHVIGCMCHMAGTIWSWMSSKTAGTPFRSSTPLHVGVCVFACCVCTQVPLCTNRG